MAMTYEEAENLMEEVEKEIQAVLDKHDVCIAVETHVGEVIALSIVYANPDGNLCLHERETNLN